MENKKLIETLKQKFSEKIMDVSVSFGDETVLIKKDSLIEIVNFLKDKT